MVQYIMIYCLALLPVALGSSYAHAASDIKFTYRDNSKTFIPESHELKNQSKVIIHAPVGDNVLLSPIVKIKINGQGPFIFLFDTGFSQSMISNTLAEKLKLNKEGTEAVTAHTPSQVVNTFQHTYLVNNIEIGDLVIHNYGMVSSSGFEDEVQDLKALKVDGVLSANAFYGLLLTLDYQKEKIYIKNGDLLQETNGVITYSKSSDVPLVQAQIKFNKLKKSVYQNFILDTGFSSYFFINTCKIPEMLNFTGKENLLSYDYLGFEQKKYFAQLYGDIVFDNNQAISSPYITFGPVNCQLTNSVGLIGRTFFEKNKVMIDQANALIKIEPYIKNQNVRGMPPR